MAAIQQLADRAALGASALCLVHCLGTPLLIAVSPALASALGFELLHPLLFVLAVPVSAIAMLAGFRRHGLIVPLLLAVGGLSLIGVGAFAGLRLALETGISTAGSALLALAHLRNLRAARMATGASPAG